MTVGLRLLWLDPDNSTVASGSQVLVDQGWTVDQARNLVEAVDRASCVQYDAVILDLQLPDALGTDAWPCIRRLQPNIVGIMTTSSSSLFGLVRIDSSGLSSYLRKPLSMQDVMETIVSRRVGDRREKLLG